MDQGCICYFGSVAPPAANCASVRCKIVFLVAAFVWEVNSGLRILLLDFSSNMLAKIINNSQSGSCGCCVVI